MGGRLQLINTHSKWFAVASISATHGLATQRNASTRSIHNTLRAMILADALQERAGRPSRIAGAGESVLR
jgi:hypothetical protein